MCSTRCIKYFIVFFNFIFFLLGVLLIGVGSWAEVKYGDFVEITQIDYASATRLVIGVGAIVTVTALFGFCGAVFLNKCMLRVYFVILLLLLILEITGTILGYLYSDKVKTQVEKDLLDAVLNKYGQSDQKGTTKAVDLLQEKEQCCGIQNYTNWFRSQYSQGNHTKLPDSCCKTQSKDCAHPLKDVTDIYSKGCFEKLKDSFYDNLIIAGSVCATLLIIQIFGMIFAILLIRGIDKGEMIA